MLLNRAIKMRIYPNDEQRHKIDVTLSHCRYIYNKMRNSVRCQEFQPDLCFYRIR